MNYLLDKKTIFSNERSRNGRVTTFKILVGLLVVFLFLGGVIYKILGPIFLGSLAMPAGQAHNLQQDLPIVVKIFSSKEAIIAENTALKNELKEFKAIALELKTLQEELKSLRAGVDLAVEPQITAKVLNHSGFLAYDSLLIDVGKSNTSPQIKKGDLVLGRGNLILGQVNEVFTRSAKVKIFSSAGSKVRILIGEDNISSEATGLGGGNYRATLPVGVDIPIGSSVRSVSGEREYLVGLVEAIEKSEEVPFQQVYIRSAVNIYQLRYVTVESNG